MLCALIGIFCPQIDAYYYPDKHDLTEHYEVFDVGSVENCRRTVYQFAALHGDPNMKNGDYECAIGPTDDGGESVRVYDKTVK